MTKTMHAKTLQSVFSFFIQHFNCSGKQKRANKTNQPSCNQPDVADINAGQKMWWARLNPSFRPTDRPSDSLMDGGGEKESEGTHNSPCCTPFVVPNPELPCRSPLATTIHHHPHVLHCHCICPLTSPSPYTLSSFSVLTTGFTPAHFHFTRHLHLYIYTFIFRPHCSLYGQENKSEMDSANIFL